MRLASAPTGSIFDQRAHICAEVFVIKFSLSAILLFEREEYLLLYESLWLYVYTLLTFYSIKKQSRTRFLAKLQTYILHDKMQNAVFLTSIWNLPRSGRENLQAPQNGSSVSSGPSGTSWNPPGTQRSCFIFFAPRPNHCKPKRHHFPSKSKPQRTKGAGKQSF